jgi:integral membrane protein
MQLLATPEGRFRLIAWLEGLSFLVLLGIAMPLKYFAHLPLAVRVAGSAHGLLFVLYVIAVAGAYGAGRWRASRAAWAVVAAVLPFGAFVFDARLRREEGEGSRGLGTAAGEPQ